MSNTVRFDPLLVRHLAEELNERLRGRGCAAAPFFAADRSVTLPLQGREELRADLHPARGFFRILPSPDLDEAELDAVIESVTAPADERVLVMRLREESRFRSGTRSLIFELATNQWNAIVRGEDGRIVSVLHARRSGERSLVAGAEYVAPPGEGRFGVGEVDRPEARGRWEAEIVAVAEEERPGRLMARFAWTGAVNGPWILGGFGGPASGGGRDKDGGRSRESRGSGSVSAIVPRSDGPGTADDQAGTASAGHSLALQSLPLAESTRDGSETGSGFDPDAAFERWWWIREIPAPRPVMLRIGRRSQPYSVALAGIPAERFPTLLDAMAAVADMADEPSETGRPEANVGRAAALAASRLAGAGRRLDRLRAELADSAGAEEIRQRGDLLLARLHEIRRGQATVRLEDWEGRTIEFDIDPLLTPAENAAKLYEEARRRERAAERLPELIAESEAEEAKWRTAAAEVEAGRIPEWLAERLARRAAATGAGEGKGGRATKGTGAGRLGKRVPGESLPYRVFRTSGGLEVWVGRGAKENDRLTFRESASNDVWLHAQAVPGAHVVLRWSEPEAAPPARDLEEAAQLAAVFSRARTSSVVAVVWTRRKHVRKPRGAPPGTVVPQRVKTVFVEPDAGVVERLAVRE